MKNFLLFCCDKYYPKGGMNDFIGDFSTLEEAKEKALFLNAEIIQIYDIEKRDIVFALNRY